MSLTVWTATSFDKAVIQREIMANAVSPSASFGPEVWIPCQDIAVNVTKDKFLLR